ncbi:MAG: hypothetical protein PWQ77_1223 [Kosmotogales bacterium]|nr:hypothetical protein [Kosmotogales bacterium]
MKKEFRPNKIIFFSFIVLCLLVLMMVVAIALSKPGFIELVVIKSSNESSSYDIENALENGGRISMNFSDQEKLREDLKEYGWGLKEVNGDESLFIKYKKNEPEGSKQ